MRFDTGEPKNCEQCDDMVSGTAANFSQRTHKGKILCPIHQLSHIDEMYPIEDVRNKSMKDSLFNRFPSLRQLA